MKRTPGPVSFSVAGVDPVEFSRDPRAAAEARIRQEKRDRLRAELDEQGVSTRSPTPMESPMELAPAPAAHKSSKSRGGGRHRSHERDRVRAEER